MSETFRLSDALEVLGRTPASLRALLGGVSPAWWHAQADEGEWTPIEIVGHLVEGERNDWIPRARIILEHGPSKPFEPFDREAMKRRTLEPGAIVEEFAQLRAANIDALTALRAEERLDAPGSHPNLGPVTLGQLLATWATHDLVHLAQIATAMAKRYREAVGPWRVYMPLLETEVPPE